MEGAITEEAAHTPSLESDCPFSGPTRFVDSVEQDWPRF
jgi:hypothetical protein